MAARVGAGSVHTDLLAHRLIPDPYAGAPEAGLQWIGLADWEYRARFDVDAATTADAHAELAFEGTDTFAEVSLNGRALLRADNNHHWRARVDGQLQASGNVAAHRVPFADHHAAARRAGDAAQDRRQLPSPYGDEPRDAMVGNFVRKPGYHFGWDWGPRYVTAGIWRPVQLESWNAQRITDVAVQTLALDARRADLKVEVDVDSAAAQRATQHLRHRSGRARSRHGGTDGGAARRPAGGIGAGHAGPPAPLVAGRPW